MSDVKVKGVEGALLAQIEEVKNELTEKVTKTQSYTPTTTQ